MTCEHGYIGACPEGCDVPQGPPEVPSDALEPGQETLAERRKAMADRLRWLRDSVRERRAWWLRAMRRERRLFTREAAANTDAAATHYVNGVTMLGLARMEALGLHRACWPVGGVR